MAGVYSTRFMLVDHPAGGTSSATVPDGHVWIVRSVDLATSTTGASGVAEINGVVFWPSGSISADSGADGGASYSGFAVLAAGDTLSITTSEDVSGQASGYDLTA